MSALTSGEVNILSLS